MDHPYDGIGVIEVSSCPSEKAVMPIFKSHQKPNLAEEDALPNFHQQPFGEVFMFQIIYNNNDCSLNQFDLLFTPLSLQGNHLHYWTQCNIFQSYKVPVRPDAAQLHHGQRQY